MFREVELYMNSEQTQIDFAKDKEYTISCFKYWLSRYREFKESSSSTRVMKQISENFHEIHLSEASMLRPKLLVELKTDKGTHIKIYQ